MLKYVILDLDGTLYEKQSLVLRQLELFSLEHNIPLPAARDLYRQAWDATQSHSLHSTAQAFFTKVNKRFLRTLTGRATRHDLTELAALAEQARRDITDGIAIRPGVRPFLEFVRRMGAKTIVFSGSQPFRASVLPKYDSQVLSDQLASKRVLLGRLGVLNLIDEIIPTIRFGGYKPERKVFRRLLAHLRARGPDCLMIGDTHHDAAAQQVGIKVIIIGRSVNTAPWTPEHFAESFAEIHSIVASRMPQFSHDLPENLTRRAHEH